MKTTFRRFGRIALLLLALAIVLPLAACTQPVENITYSDIADTGVPTFGKTDITFTASAGTYSATSTTHTEKDGFYKTNYIVLPQAYTTLTLTVTGPKASEANSGDFLVMTSYELNANKDGWTLNSKGAKYAGNDTAVAKLSSDVYTFTYVTSKANECVRLSFPSTDNSAFSDVKISIQFTPDATPTFKAESNTEWWTIAINIGLVVLLVVVFYFFIIRPSKKQEKQNAEMRNNLNVGDEITTISGIIGEIISIKDETVTIETGRDKVQLRLLRSAIHSVDVRASDKGQTKNEETNS